MRSFTSVTKQLSFSGLVISVLASCSTHAPKSPAGPVSASPLSSTAEATAWPLLHSPLARDPALEQRVSGLLQQMSVEEKVGQIIQGDIANTTPEDVRQYHLGSVLAGGNSDPGNLYNAPPAAWLKLADEMHLASMGTHENRRPIPVLLGIDAVHGHNNVIGATLFPHNIALGAANDRDLVRRIAAATAVELRATGFEWTFAPTVTVPRDDRWGRTYEGYSEDPKLVARYGAAVVEGLQGVVGTAGFLDASHVASSAKHFIGDGGTFDGKDKGDTRVSEAELRDIHGAGHIAALGAGAQTVMASFSSWNGQKMHGNASLLTSVLKQRLGFDGFVIGDWNGHGEVTGCSNESCPAALLAGVDMYMAPDSWRALYGNTLAQVRAGQIPMDRLDDAVTRILRVKMRMGLFDAGLPSQRILGGQFTQLGSPAHRALARDAVRKSLVLLKNNGKLLPLNPGSRVLVAGNGADDIGKQAGGWTLSWQGTGNKPADFPGAESIWHGIKTAVERAGGHAQLSIEGRHDRKPDVAIVVFGEDPYAEFIGDIADLSYQPGASNDLRLVQKLKAEGVPVVSVFLSGRPLWVNREINASDAFVAAWLPGSEGGGVADVLFQASGGNPAFDFIGRLPFSWPKTATQGPLNAGQLGYDPQFPLGYGMTYRQPGNLPVLPETSGLRHADAAPGQYFTQGKLAPGWSLATSGGAGPEVSAADHLAQEDARRLRWIRPDAVGAAWLQADAAVDLSRQSMVGAMLVVTMRLNASPPDGVSIGIGCGDGCLAQLPVGSLLSRMPLQAWRRIGMPLACFEKSGADLTKVDRLLLVQGAPSLDIAFSSVVLATDADQRVECSAP